VGLPLAWLWLGLVIVGLSANTSKAQETADGWSTHNSEAGGYVVDYPSSWVVEEHVDDRGTVLTMFNDPDGRSMMISAQPATAGGPQFESDLPNVRCQEVIVGGLQGQRCSDTLSRSTITTLLGAERTYTLMHSMLSPARADYDRVLDSFRLVQPEQVDPAMSGE
jgi:hypothetical protein